jgi:tetratricopeptide (TPR) repeat protein
MNKKTSLASNIIAGLKRLGSLLFSRFFRSTIRFGTKVRSMFSVFRAALSTAAMLLSAWAQSVMAEQYWLQGIQLENEGRYTEALSAYNATLREVERRFGPEHITTAAILAKIGSVRVLQHDGSAAKAFFERSLSIREKVLGPVHVQVGLTLWRIALVTHNQGYFAAAEPLYRRALTILEPQLGSTNATTAMVRLGLGKLYLAQRRNTEGEQLLEKAIEVFQQSDEIDQSTIAVALSELAGAYQRDGRYTKAEVLFGRMLAVVQKKPAMINDDLRKSLHSYVFLLRMMKQKRDARRVDLEIKMLIHK